MSPGNEKENEILLTATQATTVAWQMPWIIAHQQDGMLAVYRSVLVHDTDPHYTPVRDRLNAHEHRIVYSMTCEDQDMMFGEAVLTIYRLGGKV